MSTCGHGLVQHVCCGKPPGWFTPELLAAVDFIGYDLAAPLPRPPCAHVFLGPFDACLACGTPNPATLR